MERVRHLVFPDHPHHRKAHGIRPPAFILYIGFLIFLNLTFQFVVRVKPGILGFSSSIAPQELTALVNQERGSHGLPPLVINESLSSAAFAKGQDMFAQNYWSHVSPSGINPWFWIRRSGYDYQFAGENLAKDFVDSASVLRAWMNSPSHRDNILSDKFEDIGIAVIDGNLNGYQTTLVVEMFGTPKPTARIAQAIPAPTAAPALTTTIPISGADQPEPGQTVNQGPTPTSQALARVDMSAPPAKVPTTSPLIDSFVVVRSTSISLIFLLLGIVGLDVILVSRRQITRVGSHSLAHAVMLGILLVAVWYTHVGVIL